MYRATHLNDILASNPNLCNNPYFQRYLSNSSSHQHQQNTGNIIESPSDNHNHNTHTNECVHRSNQWIVNLFESKKEFVQGPTELAYTIAIRGVKQCTFPITNQQQAMSVHGIGRSFAAMIAKNFNSRHLYPSKNTNESTQCIQKQPQIHQQQPSIKPKKKQNKKPKKSKKPYEPRAGSGGFALLIHLYKAYTEDGVQGISKQELIRDAQQYTKSSFTEGKPRYVNGKQIMYTAWQNMRKLIEFNYVKKITRRRATFYLTEPGMLIAAKLYRKMRGLPAENEEEEKIDNSMFNDSALVTETDSKYKFKCQYCDKLYVRESPFKKHIETKHPNGSNAKPRPELLPEYHPDDDINNPKKFSVCLHFLQLTLTAY